MLVEVEKRELGGDIASLDIAPLPEGRQRSKFLAVGSFDGTVRLLSLEPADTLQASARAPRAAPGHLALARADAPPRHSSMHSSCVVAGSGVGLPAALTRRARPVPPSPRPQVLGTQAVGATPESLLLLDSPDRGKEGTGE
jgi:hypothetical protein